MTGQQTLERQNRILRYTTIVLTVLVGVQLAWAFLKPVENRESMKVEELTVERVNVVDEQGRVRVLLAGGFPPRRNELAGLLFINEEGTEAGGLVYRGEKIDGDVSAGAILTMDQYNNDQIVALQYSEANGRRMQALTMMDRPDSLSPEVLEAYRVLDKMEPGPIRDSVTREYMARIPRDHFGVRRLYVGRDSERAARIDLSDRMGTPRLRLLVDSLGNPKISFMDSEGNVLQTIPE